MFWKKLAVASWILSGLAIVWGWVFTMTPAMSNPDTFLTIYARWVVVWAMWLATGILMDRRSFFRIFLGIQ